MPDNMPISPAVLNNTTAAGRPAELAHQLPPDVAVVDPTRVVRPNQGQQADQNTQFEFSPNHPSVFRTFSEQLRQIPGLDQTLQKVMSDLFARTADLPGAAALPEALQRMSDAARMDKPAMLQNLLFQVQNSTKFSAPLFVALRGLSAHMADPAFDLRLADFLKTFNSVFSSHQTMRSLKTQLDTLVRQMGPFHGKKLQAAVEQLLPKSSPDYIPRNLGLIKEQILPLLSQYTVSTNDYGKTRDTITLLVHTLARMNLSSPEELTEKFNGLLDYLRYERTFPEETLQSLQQAFVQGMEQSAKKPENEFFDAFLYLLDRGAEKGADGAAVKGGTGGTMYHDIASSLLMDNSVYMPFLHAFLPVYYQGRSMFSEIWVEKEPHDGQAPGEEKASTVFVTFDIKNLGYFEMRIDLRGDKADVRLLCPAELEERGGDIRQSVAQIFSSNRLTAESVTLSAGGPPSVAKQIMKKIQEKRDAINVTV